LEEEIHLKWEQQDLEEVLQRKGVN